MKNIKRRAPEILALNACILSEAFGLTTDKMSEISDMKYNLLLSTNKDFIRVNSLKDANSVVANFISSLPIFSHWNLADDKILADADGQKFSATNTTQSRYSTKYFGKGRGISIYTLVANHIAINATNIGLNEYEGHALFDIIYGNKSDVEIDMVTGDNHSINKLNYVALDAIGVEYVPSVKNVKDAAKNLYTVDDLKIDNEYLNPKGEININLIKSQKKGILRVLLSLILQENSQTNIIKKLNSHTRYARLRAGLYEYNKIFNSTHVLNLIDSTQKRKSIRTARNRTEAYHQLQAMIRKTYNGIFKGRRVVDNSISAHAARLIANCIVAYNSIILNTVYENMVKRGAATDILEKFARISPIAWTHLLFTGRYSFEKVKGDINIDEIAKMFEENIFNSLIKKES